jgi:hypothetical protein
VGQYRTIRNKLKPVYSTDADSDPVVKKIGRNRLTLERHNETRDDMTKRGQMKQTHPTKGLRPMSIKRARAQAAIAAIQAHQPGAADLQNMRTFIRNG